MDKIDEAILRVQRGKCLFKGKVCLTFFFVTGCMRLTLVLVQIVDVKRVRS